MAHDAHRDDVEQRLWREIEKVHGTVMLGLSGTDTHGMQPMTGFIDAAQGGVVWFYARKDNDLVRRAGQGHPAHFTLMSKSHDFIASLSGSLAADHDRARIEQFWNPIVSAWFPEGKDDPNLTLLRFDVDEAQVWVSHGNPVRFAFEIARANLTKTLPEVGDSTHLSL